MSDDFIKMINNIDFLHGFIYECANLINNLYDYDNYDHLGINLCSEFVMPIINITKKEHIKHIIDNLESTKDIYSICSYLMNICCEKYFKLSQDEYLKIKEFDLYKKCYCLCYNYYKKKVRHIFPGNKHREFHEKIIKSYFNVWYIKFFYLLQKKIKLNIRNIRVLINIFINLYDNSNIDCNKKYKNKLYDLYNNIVLNKFVHSNKYINNSLFGNYKRV